MTDPDESRLAARLLNNTFLRYLPRRQRNSIASALDRADTFDDLPSGIGQQVNRALREYQELLK